MKFKNVILVVVIFSLGSCGLLTAGQKKIVIKNAAVVVWSLHDGHHHDHIRAGAELRVRRPGRPR